VPLNSCSIAHVKAAVIHAVGLITRALWVRFHMTLILFATVVAGIVTTFLLLRLGLRSMPARYVLAVLVGYSLFFLGVRAWLWYARRALPEIDTQVVEVEEGIRRAVPPRGRSEGDGSALADLASNADVLGIGGDGCLVVAVATLVLLAIGGLAAYVLAATPEFLGEAMVQIVLAATLRRKGKAMAGGHWAGSVVRATWGPAMAAIVLATVVGFAIQAKCPSAATLFEAIGHCRQ
jgi:hypothetical protein